MTQKSASWGTMLDENGIREAVHAEAATRVIAWQVRQEGSGFDTQTKADDAAFGGQSSSSPTLDELAAEMKRLGGPDYDFGAEEWDVLPTEFVDKMIKSKDEAGPEGQSETVDWGPDRGLEIIEDDYSAKSNNDCPR